MSFKQVLNSLADNESRSISSEESSKLKELLLDSYMKIQDVCNKYNLSVMLVGGSLLGAVRHKGFIPWDDDFDIAMPREDFKKFVDIFDKELGNDFVLDSPNTGIKASNRFPKILIKNTRLVELGMEPDDPRACIKIDLFIIENVPENRIIRTIHGIICSAAMFAAGHVDTYENDGERARAFFEKTAEGKKFYEKRVKIGRALGIIPGYKWFDIVDSVCQYRRKTKYMGIPTGRKHYFGEILPTNAFLPVSKGPFEGKEVNLPGDPDMYLTNLFGNYMEIPEEKDREKHMIYLIDFGDN